MLLKKVRLENFKKFGKLEHEFAPGINVVKGQSNEVGKSTFLDGIIMALFENPKSTSKELDKYQKWGVDRKAKTAITLGADSQDYILEKDFEAKSVRLAALKTDEEWTTPSQVSDKIRELLGTNSPTLFLSTSCIRQDEVRKIESGEKEISQSLESIVTGGEETAASQIVSKLKKQVDEMKKGTKGLAKELGPIADLTQQENRLKQEIEIVRGEVDTVESQKLKLVEVTGQLAELETTLAEKEAVLEKNKRRRDIEGEIKKLDEEYKRIDKLIGDIKSLHGQITDANSKLESIKGFDDRQKVLKIRKRLDELSAERRTIGEDIRKRKEELTVAQEQLGRNRLLVGLGSNPTLIAGAVVAAAGFLGMFLQKALVVAGIAGLLLIAAAFWARSAVASKSGRIPELKNRIQQMEDALKNIEKQQREALAEVQCATIEDFEQKEKDYSELVGSREALENQLIGKLGDQTEKQLDETRRELLKKLGVEQEKLTDDLKSTAVSPEEYVRYEDEVKKLKTKTEQLGEDKRELAFNIKNAKCDAEVLAQKEELLEAMKLKLLRAQRKVQVYELARDFIEKARTDTLVSANDKLQTETQKNFEVFTNGKYKKVVVEKGTLDFQIFSDEKGDFVQPEDLSGGAIDEFYMACRLALVQLIYGEKAPPLILDDPFVNFDEVRLKRTLDFLRQLSQKQQIIIFTLSDAYDTVADKVIELT
jgi:DNA repair exonuclease SbcCD ATPase subunit